MMNIAQLSEYLLQRLQGEKWSARREDVKILRWISHSFLVPRSCSGIVTGLQELCLRDPDWPFKTQSTKYQKGDPVPLFANKVYRDVLGL